MVAADTEEYALKEEDLPKIFSEYDRLAAEMVKREKEGRGFTFFHFMIDLTGGPCVYKRLSGCGSGTEYLAVTPWGDLYPCHQFVGQEKYLMGNVDEGIVRKDIVDEFKCCNVYTKEKCETVLQNSTAAAAAVRQIRTTSTERFRMLTILAVNFRESGLSARS